MEGRLLLKDCSIFRADGRLRTGMAILVDGGKISRIDESSKLPVLPGDWAVPCDGRLVMPGLVDCHAHLVGAQLLPLSGEVLLRPWRQRIEHQGQLDAKLTAAQVETLTAFALAQAARAGVSMVVEHLHCPGDTAGGLEAQRRAAERIGVRLLTSHATDSLGGEAAAKAQVQANAEFCQQQRNAPLVRGALGFHASSTADDALLREVGATRERLGLGAVFHVAENEDDLTASFTQFSRRIVPRLESFGLLGPGVVAAHARAVDRAEADRLAKTRTLIAISPQQDATAGGGSGALEVVLSQQNLIGLGSGAGGSLWHELGGAFDAAMHIARAGRLLDPDGLMSQLMVSGPAELCSMTYGAPSGNVEEGCMADMVIYDVIPPDESASAPHVLMRLGQVPVAWTIVAGRVLVREGQLLGEDYRQLSREAAAVLETVRREP